MRQINKEGLDKIKQWEGLRLTAYKDAAGVWTIGYGHTGAAGRPYPKEGMSISESEADNILKDDLERYERCVSENVKVTLSDNQFAALVSFCYNVGTAAFLKSTLLKKLNKGDLESVPDQLMRWTKSNGKTLKGLVNRRAAEVGLWAKGSYVSSSCEKPHVMEFRKSSILAPTGGILAGLGTLSTDNQPIQYALAAVIIMAAIVAIIYLFRNKIA